MSLSYGKYISVVNVFFSLENEDIDYLKSIALLLFIDAESLEISEVV